ncbi:MAG: MFS transporter [Mycobacteriaceae bacterium]
MRHSPGLTTLLSVRLASQFGDGLFQAALGGAILFNPERHSNPLAIATGIAVLLLPYSLLGPFAGALLDRWDRRTVLITANLSKAGLILFVAFLLSSNSSDYIVLIGALAVGGVSRFIASGLSASLPHVVERHFLITINSILATAGALIAALGAASAMLLRIAFGANNIGSALTTVCACLVCILAAFIAQRFNPGSLGPTITTKSLSLTKEHGTWYAIATGLAHGAIAAAKAPAVAGALCGTGAHRIVFGINTLVVLLLMRNFFNDGSTSTGLVQFSIFIGLTAIGLFIAACITPLLVRRFGRRPTIAGALASAVVLQIAAATLSLPLLLMSAGALGAAGQVVKLSADACMQMDIDDNLRGQVFAFQDALFNSAYVVALFLSASVIPENGYSHSLVLTGALIYFLGLSGHLWFTRTIRS